MAARARDKGLGRVWKDYDIGGTRATRKGRPKLECPLWRCVAGSDGKNRDAPATLICDHKRARIRRYLREPWLLAGSRDGDLSSAVEVKHTDVV